MTREDIVYPLGIAKTIAFLAIIISMFFGGPPAWLLTVWLTATFLFLLAMAVTAP